ncbi:MAG: preprotein translocase subunit SecG [Deltaproteobacteria bacterium]|nr:preprotein translocase subunit SecG [Deltaproteobacteria bacterium]
MLIVFLIFHALVTGFLILLVIFQQSRGAEVGAAFGGGNTLLGPGGADKLAVKITTFTAVIFMVNTVILVNLFSKEFKNRQINQVEEADLFNPPTEDAK